MSINSAGKKNYFVWFLAYAGIWLFLGILSSSQLYSSYIFEREQILWQQAFTRQMPFWIIWGILGLFIGQMSRKFPLENDVRRRNLAIHILISLLLSLVHLTAVAFFRWTFFQHSNQILPFKTTWFFTATSSFHLNLLIYWAVLGVNFAFNYYRKYNERELTSARLEKQLKQAQLDALQMQMQPHFLFNALHSISTLARKNDNQKVVKMIAGLGGLLRHSLTKNALQEIPLYKEIEFSKKYLAIEQMRFQDRLHIYFSISPETVNARVPNLILQPLIENALRHGVSPTSKSSVIEISSVREDGNLLLSVRDDGIGLSKNWETKNERGVGIINIEARLESLYGASQSLELSNLEEKGMCATIKIPFRTVDDTGN